MGKVSLKNALIHSLNIPAVEALDQIGVSTLIDKLIQLNFLSIHYLAIFATKTKSPDYRFQNPWLDSTAVLRNCKFS